MENKQEKLNSLLKEYREIQVRKAKDKKKGFTLVELLVVIAILAILATVSVVGYLGFTKKANISNDISLITQMNTRLKAEEAQNGKPATYNDMRKVIDKDGIDISRLNTYTQGYIYAWNQEENKLVLLNQDRSIVAPDEAIGTIAPNDYYKYWIAVDSFGGSDWKVSTVNGYTGFNFSHYLKDSFSYTGSDLTVYAGVDVGNTNVVSTITYNNDSAAQDVVIRSNSASTTLNVYAPNDDIAHYDACGVVNVLSAKGTSYHEYGNIAFMEINGGHVVVENDANVDMMYANPVKVTLNADGTTSKSTTGEAPVNAVSVTNNGEVEHAHASTIDVADLQNGTNDGTHNTEGTKSSDGVIFDYDGNRDQNNEDVYHHVTTSGNQTDSNKNTGVWTNSTETNIETEKDVVVSAAEEKEDLAKEENATAKYWIDIAADDFHGGKGTEAEPYQISSARELALLAEIVAGYNADKLPSQYADKCYVLTRDIDLAGKVWLSIGTGFEGKDDSDNSHTATPFTGTFDGNNKTISNMTDNGATYDELYSHKMGTWSTAYGKTVVQEGLFGYCENATIENVNIVNADFDNSEFEKSGFIACYTTGDMKISNCTVDSDSSYNGKSNIGGILGVYINSFDNYLSISNCKCSAEISISGTRAGGLIGALYSDSTICLADNCTFDGTVKGTNIGGFVGRCMSSAAQAFTGGYLKGGAHFKNCYMYGELNCSDSNKWGYVFGYCEYTAFATLDNCKYKEAKDAEAKAFTRDIQLYNKEQENNHWLGIDGIISGNPSTDYLPTMNYSVDFDDYKITYTITEDTVWRLKVGDNSLSLKDVEILGTESKYLTIYAKSNDKFAIKDFSNFYNSDGETKLTENTLGLTYASMKFAWDSTINNNEGGWKLVAKNFSI